ncbi:MAG: helix-turn-helix transcriptional regulator [Bacilli bacterium]|nr:helix-turn-helix transcriptional regulator [Bacilli bacterium]MBQ8902287.1 helix-turn-helix transcriptional regulator [Bacilli bacterium]
MLFKEYRIKRGLTQEELADKIEITWRQMQRIEKEKSLPSLQTLKKLIIILDISDEDVAQYIKSL